MWRIFVSVDRHRRGLEQITYYDDGVGTSGIRWWRLLAGATGWGVSRQIKEAYEFLAMNYEEGDRIFLFGFSRGAFAVRSLAGMICRCGLLERKAVIGTGRRDRISKLKRILKAYRSERTVDGAGGTEDPSPRQIRKCLGIDDLGLRTVRIHFVGVWDTVDAMGVPFDELKCWAEKIYRKLSGRRWWGFHDQRPHRLICNAFQALALDDERRTFHPNVWEEREGEPRVIEQVWFAGVHSNVGGGYPKDSLSLVPLLWIMHRAHRCGLRFLASKWPEYREASDPHGRLYDSRTGWGTFYRYARRDLYKRKGILPRIHATVFERIRRATDHYGPKVLLRDRYIVTPDDTRY